MRTDSIQIREDGDVVSITLPPSQYTRTVTVTKGPQPTNRVCITENVPFGPPALSQQHPTRPNTSATNATNASPARATTSLTSLYNEGSTRSPDTRGSSAPMLSSSPMLGSSDADSSAADVSSIPLSSLDLGGRVNALENTPPSLDHHNPPSHLQERPLQEQFRVSKEVLKQYPPFNVGWKKLSWVVVIRGRDIGIFHDFWARIWPLIKFTEENIIPGASWKKAESKDDAFSKWALAVGEGVTDRI